MVGGGFGNAHRGTFFCDGLHGFFFVQFRPSMFEIARDGCRRHIGLTDDRTEGPPFFAQRVFLHPGSDAHALRFDFRVEHFGFIRLTGVQEAPLCFGVVLRDLRQIAAGVEHFLGGEYAQERHFHCTFDTYALLARFDGGEFRFLAEDVPAQAEFSGGYDRLLYEKSFFTPADRAAANFVAGVANGGIRVEAGLLLAGFGGADLCFRLT